MHKCHSSYLHILWYWWSIYHLRYTNQMCLCVQFLSLPVNHLYNLLRSHQDNRKKRHPFNQLDSQESDQASNRFGYLQISQRSSLPRSLPLFHLISQTIRLQIFQPDNLHCNISTFYSSIYITYFQMLMQVPI